MKIFISHSSYDKWAARQISSQLEAAGHETFLDEKDIKTGDSIDGAIQDHLKESDHLLLLISPTSLKSHWVFIEIGGAKALGKKVVPILFHVQANEIPGAISQLLARDINDIAIYYEELKGKKPTTSTAKSSKHARKAVKPKTAPKKIDEFQVGDKVRLSQFEHLTDKDKEDTPKWTKDMVKYSGSLAIITEMHSLSNVHLSVDDGEFWWATRWFTKEA